MLKAHARPSCIHAPVCLERPGLEVVKHFMLNSARYEILNAHKYKNTKYQLSAGFDQPKMLFFLLINVKMPTTVSI